MSITSELREYANGWRDRSCCKHLLDIADRIDEEHERMHEALTIGMEPMTEENMARHGWVKLPVDADGVPIRVGDYVETLIEAFKGERGRVECLTLTEDGWCVDGDAPSTVRHVQPDSWERIIEDAANLVRGDNESVVELVERCRRLAGEA